MNFKNLIWTLCVVALLGLSVLLCGCSEAGGFCTASSEPGITLEVRDAETGLPATCGLNGWVISGSYSEVLTPNVNCDQPDSLQYPIVNGAHERAGVYTVLLIREGYKNWSQEGILVTEDRCHVNTVRIEVSLEREENQQHLKSAF